MKTYFLDFNENADAIFINENDENDILEACNILRFNTGWTGKKDNYKCEEGFFDTCNCFMIQSYNITFFELSECGDQLTDFNPNN
jgi:hypothetical protein